MKTTTAIKHLAASKITNEAIQTLTDAVRPLCIGDTADLADWIG